MKFKATIHVMLKKDVADVQGSAIRQSLQNHGEPVTSVSVGKYFEVEFDANDEAAAKAVADKLAVETFSNPTIERHWLEISPA
ncbi:MAG: phosphoribosylformylglycinamidine synthase subunit PurS [Candidatus Sumerlaeia bacterium]|nr:phosphoribosylformylglycinamidine synthase subunit PurS [Candidatus Sumerlaeia bacterium]